MYHKVETLFKAGRKNQDFLQAVKDADGDEKPSRFADKLMRAFFGLTYYGWLVAKYGDKWEDKL